jgi:hypothetical protein
MKISKKFKRLWRNLYDNPTIAGRRIFSSGRERRYVARREALAIMRRAYGR